MRKKKIFAIVSCTLLSLFLITVLLFFGNKTLVFQNNGFTRLFPPHFLTFQKVIHLKYPHSQILSVTSRKVYTGNPGDLTRFKEINYITANIQSHRLHIANDSGIAWGTAQIHMTPRGIYITEGITPTILHSDIHTLCPVRQRIDSTRFIECLPLSPSSYILKKYDPKLRQNILTKETLVPLQIKSTPTILEKQVDGVFCTDGELLFNRQNQQVIYVYRYRNEYTYMDTDLNLLGQGKTIDTISKAKIKVGKITSGSGKQWVLTAPPVIVNKKSYTCGDRLFIHSGIPADNENPKEFHKKSVIDIYSLKNRQYLHSFYIPAYRKKKMRDFAVYNNTLLVLYDRCIFSFRMDLLPET